MDRSKIFKKKKRNDLEKVHCPWCDAAFPAGGQDLEIHVEQHLAQVNFFVFAVVVLILFLFFFYLEQHLAQVDIFFVFAVVVLILFCYVEQHLAQVNILFFGHLF